MKIINGLLLCVSIFTCPHIFAQGAEAGLELASDDLETTDFYDNMHNDRDYESLLGKDNHYFSRKIMRFEVGDRVAIIDRSKPNWLETFFDTYRSGVKVSIYNREKKTIQYCNKDGHTGYASIWNALRYYSSIVNRGRHVRVGDPVQDTKGRPGSVDGILVSRAYGEDNRREKFVVIKLNQRTENGGLHVAVPINALPRN
jgi:hypothetical protein